MHLSEPYLLPLSVRTYTIVSGEGSHRLPHRKVVKQRSTGRKVEDPNLLESIRLTIINNLLKYHPESSARLAMGEAFGIQAPVKKLTHICMRAYESIGSDIMKFGMTAVYLFAIQYFTQMGGRMSVNSAEHVVPGINKKSAVVMVPETRSSSGVTVPEPAILQIGATGVPFLKVLWPTLTHLVLQK
ncbi:hypothetical protein CTI12_AA144360 [Artemisia annua]|uniref:Uncharacterized protein n=1 Tax=Artemisia annua TaxID=35608 RepID=A0A2U1PK20_ARTAN|nr:hypothetical protein CTI12_AA144360 [Artemisia annua]